jgi:hypothetical protein
MLLRALSLLLQSLGDVVENGSGLAAILWSTGMMA